MILLLSEWNMQITVDYCNSRSSATQPASSHPVRPPTFLRTNFALPIAAIQGWVLSIVFFSFSATQCVSESDDCHNTAKCGSLKRFSRRFSLPNEISLNWARETRDAAYGCVRPYRRSKLITRLIEQIRENSHSHYRKKKKNSVCVCFRHPSVVLTLTGPARPCVRTVSAAPTSSKRVVSGNVCPHHDCQHSGGNPRQVSSGGECWKVARTTPVDGCCGDCD